MAGVKKRWVALACLAALLVTLLLSGPAALAAYADVYLLGVNDTLMLSFISAESMPVLRDGNLYAPCTLLEDKGLGLTYATNRTNGTFTIFNREKTLIFYLNRAGAEDKEGNSYTARVISRDGVVFIPVRFVAEFFGLTYSYYRLPLADGIVPLARIRSSQATLSDAKFGVSAATMAVGPLRQYAESQAAAKAPPSSPEPTASPAPTPPPDEQVQPMDLSFAVACTDGGGFQTLLNAFSSAGYSALFLFSPDDLLTRDADVRSAAAAGHQIGLLLGPEDPEGDFRLGNERLSHILRAETNQVAFLRGGAKEGNWKVWSGGVAPRGRNVTAQAANLVSDINAAQGAARVTLNDTYTTAQAVQRNIRTWSRQPYTLVTVTEVGR